jgi:hypothetical protein
MDQRPYYLRQNVTQLKQGAKLLRSISDEAYTTTAHEYFGSGIGRHVRHILDHYTCFLEGEGTVDYDARNRDERLEIDRSHALRTLDSIVERLESSGDGGNVRLVIHCNEGIEGSEASTGSESSVLRELQYPASHTVHHYAIIGFILKILGHAIPENFGVAPSTIAHEKRKAE